MNMQKRYSISDITSFANYVLSDERKELVISHPEKSEESKAETSKQ